MKTRCPRCNQRVQLKKNHDGELIRCEMCNVQLRVHEKGGSIGLSLADVAVKPKAMSSSPPARPTTSHPGKSSDIDQIWSQLPEPHLSVELHSANVQQHLLQRLRHYLRTGRRDPELLYLGGRYAAAQGLEKVACEFLDPLADMLTEGENVAPAYFPVGLLYLQVLASSDPKRSSILQKLDKLSANSKSLTKMLGLAGYGPENVSTTPHQLLEQIQHNHELVSSGVYSLLDQNHRKAESNSLSKILELDREAKEHYDENQSAQARLVLEELLLLDGDQPKVLRNLITIASEQQDIEAYERYWRRYVKVLLWRIMRGDDVRAAQYDLLSFYLKVATITDREFATASSKTSERLKTSGLLSRWLEAHAALIWLGAFRQAETFNTFANGPSNSNLALMRFWYRVFYPEFYRYLARNVDKKSGAVIKPQAIRTNLPFDPSLRLIERFVGWSRFGFYLDESNENHAETLIALVGFVVRIPLQPYLAKLKDKFEREAGDKTSFQRLFQEACNVPFYPKRNKLNEAQNWNGITQLFGDEETLSILTPHNKLWLAYALCKDEQHERGFAIACSTLPDMLPEEFEEQTVTAGLFRAVFNMTVDTFMPDEGPVVENKFLAFVKRVKAVPPPKAAPDFLNSLVEPILFVKTRKDVEALLDAGNIEAAQKAVQQLNVTTDQVKEFKRKLSEQLSEIAEQEKSRKIVDETLKRVQKLVEQRKFAQAKSELNKLPAHVEEIRRVRDSWLSQLGEVEKQAGLDRQIDETINRAKALIGKDDFNGARKIVRALPDLEYTRKLRTDLLKQIDDVEKQAKESAALNRLLDSTFAEVQRYVNAGDFYNAMRAINRLPNTPPEVKKIKAQWTEQISRMQ